jgi:hypothetical protein
MEEVIRSHRADQCSRFRRVEEVCKMPERRRSRLSNSLDPGGDRVNLKAARG